MSFGGAKETFLEISPVDFPGGPVVKTLSFHFLGENRAAQPKKKEKSFSIDFSPFKACSPTLVLPDSSHQKVQSVRSPWTWPWWLLDQFLLLFSSQVVSDSLPPYGLQHGSLPCPSPSPGVCPSSCPLNQWCLTNRTEQNDTVPASRPRDLKKWQLLIPISWDICSRKPAAMSAEVQATRNGGPWPTG